MNEKRQQVNSKKFFNILLLNHFIIILIMLGLGAFHFIFSRDKIGTFELLNLYNQTSYWTLSIFMGFIFLGRLLYTKNLKRLKNMYKNTYFVQKKISEKNLLIFKMGNLRSALMTRLVLILAPIILTPLAVETSPVYFLCVGLAITYAFVLVPTKRKVIRSIEFKDSEIQRINNPKAIIARRTFSFGIGNAQQWRY